MFRARCLHLAPSRFPTVDLINILTRKKSKQLNKARKNKFKTEGRKTHTRGKTTVIHKNW